MLFLPMKWVKFNDYKNKFEKNKRGYYICKLYFVFIKEVQMVDISYNQIVMSFASTCIEAVANHLNVDYSVVYQRMNKVGLIENYIVPNYEILHTQSREYVIESVLDCLKNWENKV